MLYCTGTAVQVQYSNFALLFGKDKRFAIFVLLTSLLVTAFWMRQKVLYCSGWSVHGISRGARKDMAEYVQKDLMATVILHSMKIGKICRSIRKVVFMF